MTSKDELLDRQRRERAELNFRQGQERRAELGEEPPPRDGTVEAARDAYDARLKLAHSRLYRTDFVDVLTRLGLHLPGHSFEATANAIVMGLPVHSGCLAGHEWDRDGERERRLAGPAYPLITVNAHGDRRDPAELRRRVTGQLRQGDIVDPEVEAFEAEAAEAGDDYDAAMAVAKRWVRVYS